MKKTLDAICWLLSGIVILLVAGSIAVTALQVFFRFVLGRALFWSEQSARYMFLYIIMIGLPIAYRKGGMIMFDLLVTRFPIKIQRAISAIGLVLTGAFFAYYAVQGFRLVLLAGAKMTPGTIKIPIGFLYVAQPICAVLMFIVTIELLINALHMFFNKKGGLKK